MNEGHKSMETTELAPPGGEKFGLVLRVVVIAVWNCKEVDSQSTTKRARLPRTMSKGSRWP